MQKRTGTASLAHRRIYETSRMRGAAPPWWAGVDLVSSVFEHPCDLLPAERYTLSLSSGLHFIAKVDLAGVLL